MRMRILARPENSLANVGHQIAKKNANELLQINSLATANGFANDMAKISFSSLANGYLRQISLAIANAMAWGCTQLTPSNFQRFDPPPISRCRKRGCNKRWCLQTQTNTSKRSQTQISCSLKRDRKCRQTRANAHKREQSH